MLTVTLSGRAGAVTVLASRDGVVNTIGPQPSVALVVTQFPDASTSRKICVILRCMHSPTPPLLLVWCCNTLAPGGNASTGLDTTVGEDNRTVAAGEELLVTLLVLLRICGATVDSRVWPELLLGLQVGDSEYTGRLMAAAEDMLKLAGRCDRTEDARMGGLLGKLLLPGGLWIANEEKRGEFKETGIEETGDIVFPDL